MKFTPTPIPGAFVVELERVSDERGFIARSFCRREFAAHGIDAEVVQCNLSFNPAAGTLRGLHYQAPPHAETKLVRCTAGAIYDVIVDLRRDSAAYRRWFAVELNAEERTLLFVPEGVAHGYQTLRDNTEVEYLMSAFYEPTAARGVRWDDPSLQLAWPAEPRLVSQRDQSFPLLRE